MALKKSELYSSVWSSCDELRGGMDASQYKDYVLVMLFVKYTSDKYAGVPYAPITIPKGASFKDMVALKGKTNIGDANEYLMPHFATESGKSKGQFHTPAEVSRIMAKIIGIHTANTSTITANLRLQWGRDILSRSKHYGYHVQARWYVLQWSRGF